MAEKTVEDSKAPLIDHFIELRNRLIRSVSILGFAFFVSFIFSNQIYLFLVEPFISEMGNNSEMIFTAPQEFLIVKLKIGLFGALLICLPYLAIEMYSFIAPGLYKDEKVAMVPYFFATPLLFLIGGLLVHYIIMPLALKFFISMQIINDNDGKSIIIIN
jgi:sec-independent protein translocase protein TatC